MFPGAQVVSHHPALPAATLRLHGQWTVAVSSSSRSAGNLICFPCALRSKFAMAVKCIAEIIFLDVVIVIA